MGMMLTLCSIQLASAARINGRDDDDLGGPIPDLKKKLRRLTLMGGDKAREFVDKIISYIPKDQVVKMLERLHELLRERTRLDDVKRIMLEKANELRELAMN